jgi:hypothetical protein
MERGQGTAGGGSAAGRTDLAHFESFYDFAFPRVYRFAAKRMDTEARAEALTELILVSVLTSLGGVRGPENGLRGDPAELAFQLFAIAKRVAEQVEEDPSLLASTTRMTGPGRPGEVASTGVEDREGSSSPTPPGSPSPQAADPLKSS